jgi:hypothetical protein
MTSTRASLATMPIGDTKEIADPTFTRRTQVTRTGEDAFVVVPQPPTFTSGGGPSEPDGYEASLEDLTC